MKARTENADEMRELAKEFASHLKRKKRATIIALTGELGAGKTTFVQGVAQALGIEEKVTSPTFVIMKKYPAARGVFTQLVHIDAFRLKGKRHLEVLGWGELTADPFNLICIEWPEKIVDALPHDTPSVALSYTEGGGRRITTQ